MGPQEARHESKAYLLLLLVAICAVPYLVYELYQGQHGSDSRQHRASRSANNEVIRRALEENTNGLPKQDRYQFPAASPISRPVPLKPGWIRISVPGVGTLDIPPSLEVADGPKEHFMLHGPGKIVIQQKGLDLGKPDAFATCCCKWPRLI